MKHKNSLSQSTINLKSLENQLEGKLFYDHTMRLLYATDASAYKEMPLAVAIPRTKEDIQKKKRMAAVGFVEAGHSLQQPGQLLFGVVGHAGTGVKSAVPEIQHAIFLFQDFEIFYF